jgi:2-keto-4-pentenoate hydratase
VDHIDPRLASALAVQLERWRTTLASGAERVGWKLGVGERERIGSGPVIGHLTSATQLEPGAVYLAGSGRVVALHADAEVALELGLDVEPDADPDDVLAAIAGCGAALELVDLGGPPDDPQRIVAANVFHRAYAFGSLDQRWPAEGIEGRLIVNGEIRASAAATDDLAERVRVVAVLLAAMGERLQAGDRIIMGSIVQVPVDPGDSVTADVGALGRVYLTIAP